MLTDPKAGDRVRLTGPNIRPAYEGYTGTLQHSNGSISGWKVVLDPGLKTELNTTIISISDLGNLVPEDEVQIDVN